MDNCDQGYGAYGRAVIDKNPNSPTYGQLTDIIIISEGENYPADGIEDAFIDKILLKMVVLVIIWKMKLKILKYVD